MKRFLLAFLSIIALAMFCLAPVSAQRGSDQMVALETTRGRIVIRVFYSIMPMTAGRFLELVDNGFYNGLTFHRIENWVIQGGDPTGNGTGVLMDSQGRPQYLRFECNPGLNHNAAGAVAMARSKDPNSASCQFYITKAPMPGLNGQYAVFGRVVSGANAVMNMQRGDRIISATILEPDRPSNGATGGSGESSGGMSDEDAVPGYKPDQPAPAPNAVPSAEAPAPPPKPKLPAKYSLPGNQKPVDAGQPLPLRHSVIDGVHTADPPPPAEQQQQQPAQPKPADKPPDSGF